MMQTRVKSSSTTTSSRFRPRSATTKRSAAWYSTATRRMGIRAGSRSSIQRPCCSRAYCATRRTCNLPLNIWSPDMDNRTGGSYAVIDGELKQVEAPTVDHPEGNRPRDAKGRALDLPAPEEQPAAAEPSDKVTRLPRRGSAPAPAGDNS